MEAAASLSFRGRVCFSRVQPVNQEQIAVEPESVERVQHHTIEQIVHVPIPQIQDQYVEIVQVIPRELFSERIEEQIVDVLVPLIVEKMAEVVQIIPDLALAPAVIQRLHQ